ncbi:MAG: hypothetical protein PUP91_39570 [Rhizonema sp. PD37]|nr:hypothetical protein [Rhizonema sp. PD37]
MDPHSNSSLLNLAPWRAVGRSGFEQLHLVPVVERDGLRVRAKLRNTTDNPLYL